MGRITALRKGKGGKRVNVFVDGSFSFALKRDAVVGVGLEVGQELSAGEIERLTEASLCGACFDAAERYLSYRPRSESEVRWRLHRRGFGDDLVDGTISELKERKLIDDVAFAQFWKDNRLSFSPRSRRLIKLELRQKGIAAETADAVTQDVDDAISAYEAAVKRRRVLDALDDAEFHRRLSGYLRQRGFGYGVIRHVAARLREEQRIIPA